MKTNNLKKSLTNIRMIKAQFDELYEADPAVGQFMHSLLCDMSEQSITPDDFFAGFCYATFEHHNKITKPELLLSEDEQHEILEHHYKGELRGEDTDIIPDMPRDDMPE